MTARIVNVALLFLCICLHAKADGPGGYGSLRKETEYQQAARDAYGRGYALIESANRLDQDAAAATDERTRRRAATEAAEKYEEALRVFNDATRVESGMYEAHTYIGYASRKLGRHDFALAAYQKALQIKPDYAPAIEYQGEAYLGLDRFERAQFNYLRLYALDIAQAQKLLEAMSAWVDQRQREGNLASAQLDAATKWIATHRRSTDAAGVKQSIGW